MSKKGPWPFPCAPSPMDLLPVVTKHSVHCRLRTDVHPLVCKRRDSLLGRLVAKTRALGHIESLLTFPMTPFVLGLGFGAVSAIWPISSLTQRAIVREVIPRASHAGASFAPDWSPSSIEPSIIVRSSSMCRLPRPPNRGRLRAFPAEPTMQRSQQAPFPQKSTRHIPSAIKQEVAWRDHFKCRFVGKSSRRWGKNGDWSITTSRHCPG